MHRMRLTHLLVPSLLLLISCETGGLPTGYGLTPDGTGPRIRWDLNADDLPELPLPNDVATVADPSARTGRRINVSLIAPTAFERFTRENFDRVDGWGTYAAITIPFDEHIDAQNLFMRQGGTSDSFREDAFGRHAVYLIDMETGLPMPLDVNHGNFPLALDNPNQYWVNDPRAGESNLLFETVDEDVNGNGIMDPGEDTDFDGVLDEPNTMDGEPGDIDDLITFYERETKTLVLKPILPLEPVRQYAVVVTERLVGQNGEPVRSPFDTRHHVGQRTALEPLAGHLAAHPELYGDLAENGWDDIAFAWSFTTQSVTHDLDAIRDGLYGEGPFADLAEQFPNTYAPATVRGGPDRDCQFPASETTIIPGDSFRNVVSTLLVLLAGESGPALERIIDTFDALSHVVVMTFDSPYFLRDPDTVGLEDVFEVDSFNGDMRVARETLSMTIFVPNETVGARQPFDTMFYVHGYGSASLEPLPFAGFMLQNGIAPVLLNAEGHGVEISDDLLNLVRPTFAAECIAPAVGAVAAGRAEDFTGDGTPDSGADFWTAYVFHTRDVVRQTVVDYMRAIQVLSSFDGRTAEPARFPNSPIGPLVEGADPNGSAYDADLFPYEGLDVAGDFDGDGVPDFGGPESEVFFTGGSLGGIVSGIVAGAEPRVRASAPIVGAGGLTDVSSRSTNGGVRRAMHLRLMGPFVMTEPAEVRGERNSACQPGQVSAYFVASAKNREAQLEFACLDPENAGADDVLVVGNYVSGERRCASVTGGEMGRFRVPFPADRGDPIFVAIYPGRADAVDYGTCEFEDESTDDVILIDTFEVGAEDCERCARYVTDEWARGDRLVSPAEGYGHRRQSSNLRRLLHLAQVAIDPADPINYARRVFLEPEEAPVNLFVVNSIGDSNVPLSAGNAYARAAGVLPFLPPEAPAHLQNWAAPASFRTRFGYNSPNDLLIATHVLEGVERLNRNPQDDGPDDFLMDVDLLSEGAYRFNERGNRQSNGFNEDSGEPEETFGYPQLDQPLRWVRQSRSLEEATGDVWAPIPGEDISGLINHYVTPEGVHGFDRIIYDPALPWNPAEYLINLVARYGATGGQDLYYYSSPDTHTCLEDSSCPFFSQPN